MVSEDGLHLKDIGSRDLFLNRVAIIVGVCFNPDRALNEEIQLGTGFAHFYDRSARGYLHKSKTRMTGDDFEIISTHSLKQRKL